MSVRVTSLRTAALLVATLHLVGCGSDGSGPTPLDGASPLDGAAPLPEAGAPDTSIGPHQDASAPDARIAPEPDATSDGAIDAQPDAGTADARDDAAPLGGPDAGSDAGVDAGSDAESDGGEQAQTKVSVLTQHNDVGRSGANLAETVLTTANVNQAQFGKLYCRTVDDQIYTQPLVVPNVAIPGEASRDLVIVATMNDTVYAFEAADPTATEPVWTRSFLGPDAVPVQNTDMTGACGGNYKDISGNIGIMGTPVIDPVTSTMYLVARTKENLGSTFVQRLHALDITTGAERPNSPTTIQAVVQGVGQGGSTVTFDPMKQNQRAALLLQDGLVYIAWASHCDWGPYNGWLMGYDAQSLQQVVTFNTTPDGDQGGLWMSGQGPAADANGSIYIVTGNGSVGVGSDPTSTRNRAQSALRLTRTTTGGANGTGLDVASWFTPHDFLRLNEGDLDLGSGGMLLVPGTNLALAGGKGSKLYLLDRTTMGGLSLDRTDGPGVETVPLNAQHLHGAPVYWNGPGGPLLFAWAEYDHLKSFLLDPVAAKFDPVPLAESPNAAPNGMPGGMLSVSANGNSEGTGILWAYLPLSGDANQAVVSGELHAFDAANIGVELWNSDQNAARDFPGNFAKFTSPTVANGQVYLATFSDALCVYGLLPNVVPLGAPTGLTALAASKTSADLQWVLHSTGETSLAIERKEGALGFAPIATASAGATSFVDTSAVPFASYSYRVRALGSGAPSAYSNVAAVVMNAGAPAARITLSGNDQPIAFGAPAASPGNGTDYGATLVSGATRVFTLRNVGNAPLDLTLPLTIAGTDASTFAVTAEPSSPVAPGGTTTFSLAFTAQTPGPKAGTVQIASNDPNQSPFTFAVAGSGIGDQVGWWKLDETGGVLASDSSGQGNDGTTTAVTWVTGHISGGGSFDGASSEIAAADNASLDPYAIGVAVWINPIDWNGNRRILQKGQYDDEYRLLAEGGVFKFDIAGVGTITTTLPPVNVWTHIAATYDGATLRLYVNAVEVASLASTTPMPATPDPFFIGAKEAGGATGDHFYGTMDDLHLYGRALTPAEIATFASQ